MKKGRKIVIQVSITMADTFADFLLSRKAKGLSEKTLTTYKQHLAAIGKHLDITTPIDALTKQDLESMIASMRDTGLASNSIKSYTLPLVLLVSQIAVHGNLWGSRGLEFESRHSDQKTVEFIEFHGFF